MIKFNVAYNIGVAIHQLNVNPTYSNEMACAQFIAVIGDPLKQKTAADVGNATYMSFTIHGETDVSLSKECVIVYSHISAHRETGQHFNCRLTIIYFN